jgi:hypothetical protein
VKRIVVVAGFAILTTALSACQSTEQESARIARQSKQQTSTSSELRLGGRNHAVRVSHVTLLDREGRLAVAAQLTSTAARPQRDIPILVTIAGRGGKTLYSNAAGGIEPALQRIALLEAHQSAWWVDDQVLLAGAPTRTDVKVGAAGKVRVVATATPATRAVHTVSQAGIATIAATLVNRSTKPLSKVAVFGVALRGGRVVAAGRAAVAALAGRVGASTPFQIVLIGDPSGAKIELTAVPSGG